jgi:hypothetical protein
MFLKSWKPLWFGIQFVLNAVQYESDANDVTSRGNVLHQYSQQVDLHGDHYVIISRLLSG